MSEHISHTEEKAGSEKGFGILFAVVFLLLGCFPLMSGEEIRLWATGISIVFLLLAFLVPKALSLPNKLWFKFGMLLGAVIAPLAMALIYFMVVTPMGLIAKLMGKDLLQQKIDKNSVTYWIKRDAPVGTMKDQF